MISFTFDYNEGAHPTILRRLTETNMLQEPGYGNDQFTLSAIDKIRQATRCPQADIVLLVGGTQTNATVIDAMLPHYGAVIAAETGHIAVHESGAVDMTGHKVITLPQHEGKMLPEELRNRLLINWYGHNKFSYYDHSLEEGQQKIEAYGLTENFIFHEPTLGIYEHMRQADAIGLFSQYEGFPNAICEGMFLAKPIVSTRVSDIPLLLQEDENAFLCDAASPQSIADALTKFLCATPEQLKRMGETNRHKAQEMFDEDKILNQYEQLFDKQ